jgi:hypothetical protein
MTNQFNAEQARQNASEVQVSYSEMLDKILKGTETLSKVGRRSGLFSFPAGATASEHIVAVESELRNRGFTIITELDKRRDTINIELGF